MIDLSSNTSKIDSQFTVSYGGKVVAVSALLVSFLLGGAIAHSQFAKTENNAMPEQISLSANAVQKLNNVETIDEIKSRYKESGSTENILVRTAVLPSGESKTPVREVVNSDQEIDLDDYFAVSKMGVAPNESKLELIKRAVEMLPKDHAIALQNLVIRYDSPTAHRGLGGKTKIILRGVEVTDDEFVSVFIHEMGHIVDLGKVVGSSDVETEYFDGNEPIYSNDASVDFYSLCWADTKTRNEVCSSEDFVSGYAGTDAFEDFAESYLAYVLHGKEFLKKAGQSKILMLKYAYLKELFHGKEYDTGNIGNLAVGEPWDMTIVPL